MTDMKPYPAGAGPSAARRLNALLPKLDPRDSFIKIGDRAKRYTGEEYGGIVYDF